MKTKLLHSALTMGVGVGLILMLCGINVHALEAPPPGDALAVAAPAPTEAPAPDPTAVGPAAAGPMPEVAAAPSTGTIAAGSPTTETVPIMPPAVPQSDGPGLKFNFRGVPVDTVLDYMSSAAGFVIIRDADVRGTVDVVSHQSITSPEAVLLLNTILNQKGLAAIQNERTLTIVERDTARTRDIPIRLGGDPLSIPKTDSMVTQIIPVLYTDVNQLMTNLEPLLPDYSTITANQSSNAILITDTQTNIRRAAEIIQALDRSFSQAKQVRIFKMHGLEASEVAEIINQVIGGTSTGGGAGGGANNNDDARRRFFEAMRNRGGFGGSGFGGRGRGR